MRRPPEVDGDAVFSKAVVDEVAVLDDVAMGAAIVILRFSEQQPHPVVAFEARVVDAVVRVAVADGDAEVAIVRASTSSTRPWVTPQQKKIP